MTVEVFANQALTTVTSGGTTAPVSGTQETWTVFSSTPFPAANSGAVPPTEFHVVDVTIGKSSEIIAVTNVSGTTWTVTRGAESTTPVAHNAGFTIQQVVTAGYLTNVAVVTDSISFAGSVGGTDFVPTGLVGATTASRYVGATTGGAPATGTFAVGDFVVDTSKRGIWVCGTAGTPGTWFFLGPINTFDTGWIQPTGTAAAVGNTGFAADAGHVHAGLSFIATTGTAGFALQNATPSILTWNAPNDGQMHQVIVNAGLDVTSAETGGKITMDYTDPAGGTHTGQVYAPSLAAGWQIPNGALSPISVVVSPNTTVTLAQNTALTSGTATLYASLFAL